MKHISFVVFVVGLTVACWYASKVVPAPEPAQPSEATIAEPDPVAGIVRWFDDAGLPFLAGLGLMIIGGVMARRAQRPTRKTGERASEGPYRGGGTEKVVELLNEMAASIDALDASTLPEGSAKLAEDLDGLLTTTIPDFLDYRRAMIDDLGLETFAELIGHFASMERGAARAWSAITDEAWAEVPAALERAQIGIGRARDIARKAKS